MTSDLVFRGHAHHRNSSRRQSSRSGSRQGSRRGSSRAEGTSSKRGSMARGEVKSGGGHEGPLAQQMLPHNESGDHGEGVLLLKGLPQAEMMIGRKMFRANSMDFTNNAETEAGNANSLQPSENDGPQPVHEEDVGISGKNRPQSPKRDSASAGHTTLGSQTPQTPNAPGPRTNHRSSWEAGTSARKVKSGVDSRTLVTDAIGKLASIRDVKGHRGSGGSARSSLGEDLFGGGSVKNSPRGSREVKRGSGGFRNSGSQSLPVPKQRSGVS
eukprot:gnl/TRDRNA2_/TRDRNA2_148817_c3_seq1.p1 gnl/TRDRNA2_/TRDRNA2_148817_c3~~gnl/TRDRNA2_/TRDRNA2_148817_c3_seq1.p1  ORF type:complete len:270 (+),score=27.74 gnl/TRDRNA2_/TRDRNA2_148817_c3_seq1:2-811(+)